MRFSYVVVIVMTHLACAFGKYNGARFVQSDFEGLSKIENARVEIVPIQHPSKRSNDNANLPHIIKTSISGLNQNIEINFVRQHERMLSPLVFGGRSELDPRFDSVATDEDERTHFFGDKTSNAHAIVTSGDNFEDARIVMAEVYYDNELYAILPASTNDDTGFQLQHHLYKVNNTADFTNDYRTVDTTIRRPKFLDFNNRVRRGTVTNSNVVEVVFVVDYKLYQFWYELTTGTAAARETSALAKIRTLYSFIANSIHLRYQGLSNHIAGLNVGMKLTEIYVIKTSAEATFIQNVDTSSSTKGLVTAEGTLSAFQTWVDDKKSTETGFPNIDHYMLLTGHDLTRDGNIEAAGLANLGSMCTAQSISVVEGTFDFLTAVIASHELAHGLNGHHDGDGNTCSSDDKYILSDSNAAKTGDSRRNPWLFSSCSATAISNFIDTLTADNNNCLKTEGSSQVVQATGTPPGQLYQPDRQCELVVESGSILARKEHLLEGGFEKICTGMWCQMGSQAVQLVVPAVGTTCGNGKWCWDGQCVTSQDAPVADETCLFGDDPRDIEPGVTCTQKVAGFLGNCYGSLVGALCCFTCAAAKLTIPDCEYGDRSICTAISNFQCYTATTLNSCCKTCHDFEVADAPSDCKYGDKTSNCETQFCNQAAVATQCCQTCSGTSGNGGNGGQTTDPNNNNNNNNGGGQSTQGTTDAPQNNSEKDLPKWVIPVAAGVGGVVAVVLLIGILSFCVKRGHDKPGKHPRQKYRQHRRHSSDNRRNRHNSPERSRNDNKYDKYNGSTNNGYDDYRGYDKTRHGYNGYGNGYNSNGNYGGSGYDHGGYGNGNGYGRRY